MMEILILTLILGAFLLAASYSPGVSTKWRKRRSEPAQSPSNDSTKSKDAWVVESALPHLTLEDVPTTTALSSTSSTTSILGSTKGKASIQAIASTRPIAASISSDVQIQPSLHSTSLPPAMAQLTEITTSTTSTPSVIIIYGVMTQVEVPKDIPGATEAVTKTVSTTIAITLFPGQLFSTPSISGFRIIEIATTTTPTASSFSSSSPPNGVESIAHSGMPSITTSSSTLNNTILVQATSQYTITGNPRAAESQYYPPKGHAASIAGIITGAIIVSIALVVGTLAFCRKRKSLFRRASEIRPTEISELSVTGHMRYELSNAHLRYELPVHMPSPVELEADQPVGGLSEKLIRKSSRGPE
jgi:hypothetical protein